MSRFDIRNGLFSLKTCLLRALRRPLSEFRRDVYSQNGEDGIVEELLDRLRVHKGWVVEFGAWDGIKFSNTYNLIERGNEFRAVFIEGDNERYQDLSRTVAKFEDRVIVICKYVEPSGDASLERVLGTTPLPYDFEILSIDVDGIDYQIWERFEGYHPKIVVIEVNSSIPPDKEQVHGANSQGTSFLSMLRLGRRKGYACVCHTGNMFFVRNDLLDRVGFEQSYLSSPELLFCRSWLKH